VQAARDRHVGANSVASGSEHRHGRAAYHVAETTAGAA
jgi:hypothetical protein